MRVLKRKRASLEVNLTPLIDIVFLLLIFFMVSTTFTKESRLTLNLPESAAAKQPEQNAQLEVVVSAAGEYVVNGRPLVNKQVTTLEQAMAEFADGRVDMPVVITADRDARHQAVILVFDAASKLGLTKIGITTTQNEP